MIGLSDIGQKSNLQESDISTPIPAAIVSIEPVGIIQLSHVQLGLAHEVVVAAHHSSKRTHEAAY